MQRCSTRSWVFLGQRSAVAENLACSGCVTEAMLDAKLVGDLARKSQVPKWRPRAMSAVEQNRANPVKSAFVAITASQAAPADA